MAYAHTIIQRRAGHHERMILDTRADIVEGRIRPEDCRLLGDVWVAVLRDPTRAHAQPWEPEHVCQGDVAHDGTEEIGALSPHHGSEEPAVRYTEDTHVWGRREPVPDELLGHGGKVVV